MRIRSIVPTDSAEWRRMRVSLWPEDAEDHAEDIDDFFAVRDNASTVIVAECDDGSLCGFVEVGLRSYAEDCESSPVGYLEGWWVDPTQRLQGVGRALVSAAEAWVREQGLTEIASDTLLSNAVGEAAHRALGYDETARLICFRKSLGSRQTRR